MKAGNIFELLKRGRKIFVHVSTALAIWVLVQPNIGVAIDKSFFAPLDKIEFDKKCAKTIKTEGSVGFNSEALVLYSPSIRKIVKDFLERQIRDLTSKSKFGSVLTDRALFVQTKSTLDRLMQILDESSVETTQGRQIDLSVLHAMRFYLETNFPVELNNRAVRGKGRLRRRITELAELFREHHLVDKPQFLNRSGKYLDVGAGSGQIASGLAIELGILSANTYALELAKYPNAATDIQWITYDENGRIPLPDNSVDIISLMMVFHHAPDPVHLFKEVFRVLKPGGIIVIRETNADRQPHLKLTAEEMVALNQILDNMLYVVFDPNSGVPMMNNYRPKAYWNQLFSSEGGIVTEIPTTEIGSPFQPMYFLVEKPKK